MLLPVLTDPAALEVVVVVDGADPAAEAVLSRLAGQHPRLRWQGLDPSGGTARAKLAGAAAARGDVLVLLDDDVLAGAGLVASHLDRHRQADGLVVVGSMPVADADPHAPTDLLDGLAGRVYARNYATSCESYAEGSGAVLRGLWGGNVSVRRADYLRLAPDLLRYPRLAHEDTHFGRVAEAAGLLGVYEPRAAGVHLHRRSWEGMLRESERQGRGQRALHLVHQPGVPFDDARLPEPLHPLVSRVVLGCDGPQRRRAVLATLRLSTRAALRARRPDLAVRLAFAATQLTRRVGRRDLSVEDLVARERRSGP